LNGRTEWIYTHSVWTSLSSIVSDIARCIEPARCWWRVTSLYSLHWIPPLAFATALVRTGFSGSCKHNEESDKHYREVVATAFEDEAFPSPVFTECAFIEIYSRREA
jgi:hypothetical protein